MIAWTDNDRQFIRHTVETMADRMLSQGGYTEADDAALDKLQRLGNSSSNGGVHLMLTGDEIDRAEADLLLQDVVKASMGDWVPNASQRLISRAAGALGRYVPEQSTRDHGPNPGDHALVADWVAGMYVEVCVTCARLFEV